jgi:hypothetical protein
VWSAKIAERREDSTADTYRHWVDKVVLPQLGELRLHQCDVARLDGFFRELERARVEVERPDGSTTQKPRYAANTRRTIRTIVSGVLQQAVLQKAIASNRHCRCGDRLGPEDSCRASSDVPGSIMATLLPPQAGTSRSRPGRVLASAPAETPARRTRRLE